MQTFVVATECLMQIGAVPILEDRLPAFLKNYQKAINRIHIGVIFVFLILSNFSSIFAMQQKNEDAPEAVFFALAMAYLLALYSIFVWKGTKMVDLMIDLNKMIETRKFDSNIFTFRLKMLKIIVKIF